ncbi:hypothetical protein [Microscilla marina]|uniref:Uncharacterized protein n=1 Tax=Microscilla marina ATCC 23134 TaxID=313606 RepID=A1ZD38_MICM2|nr:hypothetical protein [Microscilla marina]EAY31577.1 hypothetical protein M23134_05083 [Microscilla marina ATCC 23134]
MSKAIQIASRSFDEILQSENATRVLHLMMHKLMGEGCSYDATHELLLVWYNHHEACLEVSQPYVYKYMRNMKRRLNNLKKHRTLLRSYLDTHDFVALEAYVYQLSFKGVSKKKIYEIFNDFFVFVEYHHQYSTEQADLIADCVLDRLSGWRKDRLLPQEPDVT